ncbi:MAG: bifunctional 2-C-methyl-D-erythritol 4-phosphate cytidylyltransferase/2-C-methyl-D-erythritol 2,4-cyclodiphosphate synthase [Proteobacteria bacterium]|nr:bifunctional 2-C-methyl-D-erythritol 4-phosphate cytidylyltransferase/2-C-methyl-D-erythritol 2,4-cyclodiphosphate synthase [Pseudomonadota bacterium]
MASTVALVVAAGRGSRFGTGLPKQYAALGGRPLLGHSLEAFARHPRIDRVKAVIHPDDRALYERAAAGLDLLEPAAGGATRQDSVRRGLESLEALAPAAVLIHDGARPFVDAAVIDRVLDALASAPGAIAALPVTDTLKRSETGKRGQAGHIAATLERAGLWRAQTPQGFRFAEILAAHRAIIHRAVHGAVHGAAAGPELTDDAAVAERAGLAVALVEGTPHNIKVTTRDDLLRAERWLAGAYETRVGQGFDVHRFAPGDHVMLCGLRVPHEAGLKGHSDADVGLHALTDAILGALGAGDIGVHFPPSDARWKDADSAVFLTHARDLVATRGGRIAHVDVTLVCERPRIGDRRVAMVARLAELLGIEAERVSVKATTTEGLGFTGRGEGIAAQATATLSLPTLNPPGPAA